MGHALDGAKLKIIRAQEHLDSLRAEIFMYLQSQPDEIRSQPDGDLQMLAHEIFSPPPLRLSTIIGDCLTNVRAALDYVVFELARKYFDKPPFNINDSRDREITAFPIWDTTRVPWFCKRLDRLKNRGIPAGPRNEIESVQPNIAGYEPVGWLHELVNRDKHRMPLLTVSEFDEFTITLITPPPIAETASVTVPKYFTAQNMPIHSNVQMKAQYPLYVAWKDVPVPSEPVERTLDQIIKCAAEIIPRFDTFL